jgi:hypothetical protein
LPLNLAEVAAHHADGRERIEMEAVFVSVV